MKFIVSTLLLIINFQAISNELLIPIDPDKARRLAHYNADYLSDLLFAADRYRIVKVDATLLLQARTFTITPFEGTQSLQLVLNNLYSDEGDIQFWKGTIVGHSETAITIHSWDIDPDGNASPSFLNRFAYSPDWDIDELGRASLAPGRIGHSGRPPKTYVDIERHRRLKQLRKHQFHAVTADLELSDGTNYLITPLKYTPRYAVIYEMNWIKEEQAFLDEASDSDGVVIHRMRSTFNRKKAIKADIE